MPSNSMQLLVQQLSPEPSDHGFGIVTMQTASYVLQAYRPETGVQFFVTADLKTENLASFLVRCMETRWKSERPSCAVSGNDLTMNSLILDSALLIRDVERRLCGIRGLRYEESVL